MSGGGQQVLPFHPGQVPQGVIEAGLPMPLKMQDYYRPPGGVSPGVLHANGLISSAATVANGTSLLNGHTKPSPPLAPPPSNTNGQAAHAHCQPIGGPASTMTAPNFARPSGLSHGSFHASLPNLTGMPPAAGPIYTPGNGASGLLGACAATSGSMKDKGVTEGAPAGGESTDGPPSDQMSDCKKRSVSSECLAGMEMIDELFQQQTRRMETCILQQVQDKQKLEAVKKQLTAKQCELSQLQQTVTEQAALIAKNKQSLQDLYGTAVKVARDRDLHIQKASKLQADVSILKDAIKDTKNGSDYLDYSEGSHDGTGSTESYSGGSSPDSNDLNQSSPDSHGGEPLSLAMSAPSMPLATMALDQYSLDQGQDPALLTGFGTQGEGFCIQDKHVLLRGEDREESFYQPVPKHPKREEGLPALSLLSSVATSTVAHQPPVPGNEADGDVQPGDGLPQPQPQEHAVGVPTDGHGGSTTRVHGEMST